MENLKPFLVNDSGMRTYVIAFDSDNALEAYCDEFNIPVKEAVDSNKIVVNEVTDLDMYLKDGREVVNLKAIIHIVSEPTVIDDLNVFMAKHMDLNLLDDLILDHENRVVCPLCEKGHLVFREHRVYTYDFFMYKPDTEDNIISEEDITTIEHRDTNDEYVVCNNCHQEFASHFKEEYGRFLTAIDVKNLDVERIISVKK